MKTDWKLRDKLFRKPAILKRGGGEAAVPYGFKILHGSCDLLKTIDKPAYICYNVVDVAG